MIVNNDLLAPVPYRDLHDNNLSGVIPEYLGGMLNLQILNLGNNKFSGSIPADLGQLPNLKHL